MTMKSINVGLIGIGTVGGGTWTVLNRNAEEISRRAGCPIRITAVADKNVELAKQVTGGAARVTDDAFSLVNDPDIDVIVELIGGYGVAKEVVMQSIANGKHVVTANKALLAVHGTEIFTAAQAKGVMVAFEAAVAGGIPIIKALREGLTANRIQWAAGIINGTTNFILSEMRDKGLSFDDVLKEAQRLGYAEADPTFDIEGVDAAHKADMVRSVFSNVAGKYDLMNDAMSGGAHRLWKNQFVRRVKPRAGEAILDMAGGTGDIAFRIVEMARNRGGDAAVTVCDINAQMLGEGTLVASSWPLWLRGLHIGDRAGLPLSPVFAVLWVIGGTCALAAAWQAKYHRLAALALVLWPRRCAGCAEVLAAGEDPVGRAFCAPCAATLVTPE